MSKSQVIANANEIAALIAALPETERLELWGVLIGMGLAKEADRHAS